MKLYPYYHLVPRKYDMLPDLFIQPGFSVRMKLKNYEAIIRSALIYGALLLTHIRPSTAKLLQQLQNGILREITKRIIYQKWKAKQPLELFDIPETTEVLWYGKTPAPPIFQYIDTIETSDQMAKHDTY